MINREFHRVIRASCGRPAFGPVAGVRLGGPGRNAPIFADARRPLPTTAERSAGLPGSLPALMDLTIGFLPDRFDGWGRVARFWFPRALSRDAAPTTHLTVKAPLNGNYLNGGHE